MTAKRITSWLNDPKSMTDPEEMAALAKQFPYCSIFHYLNYFNAQDEDRLYVLSQLYPINPVLRHTFLHGEAHESTRTDQTADQPIAIEPTTADDYFAGQGFEVAAELPEMSELQKISGSSTAESDISTEQSLMVVMTFAEWLSYLQSKTKKAQEEEAEKSALRAMWQKQTLAAAIEEETDEIPDEVFKMAVNSITQEDEIVSEALAEVYAKQGRYEKSIDIYKKLSLRNPEKKSYFANQIERLKKEIEL